MPQDPMITISIKSTKSKRIKSGHPWIFSNEVEHPNPKPEAGSLVRVVNQDARFLGYATYNPHSLIALRILSRDENDEPASVDWMALKFRSALALRERLYPGRTAYRLVFGDSDCLPGCVIDRYGDVYAIQTMTAGMERLLDMLIEALKQTLNPQAIVLRNDLEMRALEALPRYVKTVFGEVPEALAIVEHEVKMQVDVLQGQKTGHFFDQAENRLALAAYAKNKTIVDLFCHAGAWALAALNAGAKHAICVDSSKPAITQANINAALNGVEGQLECANQNAFDWLSAARKDNRSYDVVVVDPPAFTKSAKQARQALRGYEDLNRQAIHAVKPGGVLCSCSCSYHIDEAAFIEMLRNAAARENRQVQLLEIRGQARDHPVLLSMPESRYLKCVIGIVR